MTIFDSKINNNFLRLCSLFPYCSPQKCLFIVSLFQSGSKQSLNSAPSFIFLLKNLFAEETGHVSCKLFYNLGVGQLNLFDGI